MVKVSLFTSGRCLLLYLILSLALYLVMGASITAQAATYSNAINDKGWKYVGSVFECRIEHKVPFYGDAVFRTRAGEASVFYLREKSSRFQAGEATIIARNPIWINESKEFDIGKVPIKRGRRPMWLGDSWAEKMLGHLNLGREVEISHDTWYDPPAEQPANLQITSIGFKKAYRRYLNCLPGLIPGNFDQLKRTSLQFPAGVQDELTGPLMRKLDQILKLVKYDSKVRLFYIDGHADSMGDRAENLQLSKVRAELVSQYLKRRGVPEDWITLRWHGERYPVASNTTKSGRAKNRRVTVRLEKVEEIEVLPLASKE